MDVSDEQQANRPDIEPCLPTGCSMEDCHVALVGEAPGADEVVQRQPFVGRAGKLLDQALDHVGLERKRCYITNVFWNRPPNNKVDHFFTTALSEDRSERYPPFRGKYLSTRWESEMERLAFELYHLDPTIVVALGATPLWALTGLDRITTYRGEPMPIRGCIGGCEHLRVIATFHPAYILRQPSSLDTMIGDLAKVAENLPK